MSDRTAKAMLAMGYEYNRFLGMFHGNWAALELVTDWAICKFLNLSYDQGHLITAGMMFGRKGRLLADLVARSDHPKKSEILGAFNRIRGMSKRDVFAHSYVRSDEHTVTFLDRSSSGEFRAVEHTFTLEEFTAHVTELAVLGDVFYNALGATREDVNAFATAALSLNRKSKKPPDAESESDILE